MKKYVSSFALVALFALPVSMSAQRPVFIDVDNRQDRVIVDGGEQYIAQCIDPSNSSCTLVFENEQ